MDRCNLKGELHRTRSTTQVPLKLKKLSKISKKRYLKRGMFVLYSQSTSRSCHVIGRKPSLRAPDKKNNTARDGCTLPVFPAISPVLCPVIDSEMQLAKLKAPKTPEVTINSDMQLSPDINRNMQLCLETDRDMQLTKLSKASKTADNSDISSDRQFESLPMDLLVEIMCHLNHDELPPVFHVSQSLRQAVSLARDFHFNYTTPYRAKPEIEMPDRMAPARSDENNVLARAQQCPNAPPPQGCRTCPIAPPPQGCRMCTRKLEF